MNPKALVIVALIGAGIGLFCGVFFGAVAALEFPIFGTFAVASPRGSPVREQAIPLHSFIFGMLGLVFGAVAGVATLILAGESRLLSAAKISQRKASTLAEEVREKVSYDSSSSDPISRARLRKRKRNIALGVWAISAILLLGSLATVAVIFAVSRSLPAKPKQKHWLEAGDGTEPKRDPRPFGWIEDAANEEETKRGKTK